MFFEGLLAIIIFAFIPLAIKFTAATPITICLFRLLITVIALAIIWNKKIEFKKFYLKGSHSWKLWIIGLIFFFHWITYAYSVKLGGPSIGALGLSTYGLQLVIAGVLFLGHHISKKNIFCLSLSMVGIMMIIPSWNFKNETTQGLLLSLISATFFALLPIIHQKTQEFALETRIFAQFFGSFLGFFLFVGKTHWDLKRADWFALVFLGFFGTLIAHSLWVRVSAKTSTINLSLAYYTIAPITIGLSHLLLGESFTWLQMSGAFIIILSAIVNIFSFKSRLQY
jgi:drug/metabolite transporter (DMT)-like permease